MSTDRLTTDHDHTTNHDAAQAGDTGRPEPEPGRGRRVAFRVLGVVVALLLTAIVIFGLTELVFAWLPEETVRSVVDDPELLFDMHRSHYMAIGLTALAVVACAWAQVRRPARRAGSMLLLLAIATGAGAVYSLSGPLGTELVVDWLPLALVLLLAALHPARRELLRRPDFDRPMGLMAAAAAVPWAVYALGNAVDQVRAVAGEPHAVEEHYAAAALLGIVVIAAATIGASDHVGRRLPAWLAVICSVVFGVHSLVFPGVAGAAPDLFALGAIVWGAAFAVADVQRARGGEPVLATPATT